MIMEYTSTFLVLAQLVNSVRALSCVQCNTDVSAVCSLNPPPPRDCTSDSKFCLTLKEFDKVKDERKLIFLARTCVQDNSGDVCTEGRRGNKTIIICREHCGKDSCNTSEKCKIHYFLIFFISFKYLLHK
ncbi:uncharacterized protein LOC111705795 [Eurytemora carolleeae]|uniref:uncharacterized protein LOC111705795 n=1 Tax=Eurytemora carolleeae TaxID=1294199 RepID=UPI000C764156|nr:uncharacterized protein LOC111705795 [Eurytemora carolleeae]|eukprot:XP_023334231.1 uncharacterized protein LOC111705795 [Eurytemora affinis]